MFLQIFLIKLAGVESWPQSMEHLFPVLLLGKEELGKVPWEQSGRKGQSGKKLKERENTNEDGKNKNEAVSSVGEVPPVRARITAHFAAFI